MHAQHAQHGAALSAVEHGPRKALRAVALRTTTRRLPLPASTAPCRAAPVPAPEAPQAPPPEPTPDDDEYWFGDDEVAALSGKPSAAGGGSSGGQGGASSGAAQPKPGGNATGKSRWGRVSRDKVTDGSGWSQAAHNWKDLRKDVEAALRDLPELGGASDDELHAMAAHSKLLTLPRYGKLWRKRTPMLSFFVLLRGQLRSPASRGIEGRLVPIGSMLCGGAWLESTVHLDCPVAEKASVLLCVNASEAKAEPLLERICVHLREGLGEAWKVELLKVEAWLGGGLVRVAWLGRGSGLGLTLTLGPTPT